MIGFHISHILYAGRRSEVCSTTQVLQPIVDSINLNKKIWDMYFTVLLPRLVKEGHDGTTIFIYKITALHQPLSPFGKDVIATGGVDTHVVIFGQASRQILHTLTGHSQKVTSVKFVPRDELFVTGSGDKMKLILW